MKKFFRVFCFALAFALVLGLGAAAHADGNVTYSGSTRQFIFEPGTEYSPTDLFPDFKNVMPGDVLTERVEIRNDSFYGVAIQLFMRSLGAQLETNDFLSQLHLQVQMVEDTYMFDAPADQTAQLTDWNYLGTLYSGGEVILEVTLTVPKELGNEYMNNIGYIDWQFLINETPASPYDPIAPQTGDDSPVMLYAALAFGSFILALLLFLAARRRNKT